jgi:hypothetical protein
MLMIKLGGKKKKFSKEKRLKPKNAAEGIQ